MIRDAVPSDIDRSYEMYVEAYERYIHKELGPFDWQHMKILMAKAIAMPNFFGQISEHEGVLQGTLFGMLEKNFWGHTIANAIVCFSLRDSVGLIRNFEAWGHSKGAKIVTPLEEEIGRKDLTFFISIDLSPSFS